MLIPLIFLGIGAIFSGYLFKNTFIGHQSSEFWQNSIFFLNEIKHEAIPLWFLLITPVLVLISIPISFYLFILSPKVIVGAIIVTIIAFFKDLILDTLGYLGQKFKEFIGFADTDFGQEAKDFYGNLLSGGGTDAAEKLVTTGPPLLVPPTAVPDFISAAAPNLIVNNNQVNQTSSSTTQQMSNVTIIDRQQEQSGL